jgi:hypothetical protein
LPLPFATRYYRRRRPLSNAFGAQWRHMAGGKHAT